MLKLGDRVADRITGFTGIATARTEWLNKCVRISVQPEGLDKDGKMQESQTFDIELLKVVHSDAIAVKKEISTGGPDRNDPKRPADITRG